MVRDHHPANPERQTTVSTCVRSIFAQAREDDRVPIDADTASGTLGASVDPHATGS
jgi:MinD-like ATPase involved in chromosome partitioning or flagellar assembly